MRGEIGPPLVFQDVDLPLEVEEATSMITRPFSAQPRETFRLQARLSVLIRYRYV